MQLLTYFLPWACLEHCWCYWPSCTEVAAAHCCRAATSQGTILMYTLQLQFEFPCRKLDSNSQVYFCEENKRGTSVAFFMSGLSKFPTNSVINSQGLLMIKACWYQSLHVAWAGFVFLHSLIWTETAMGLFPCGRQSHDKLWLPPICKRWENWETGKFAEASAEVALGRLWNLRKARACKSTVSVSAPLSQCSWTLLVLAFPLLVLELPLLHLDHDPKLTILKWDFERKCSLGAKSMIGLNGISMVSNLQMY